MDIEGLLKDAKSGDPQKAWAAVGQLVKMRPATAEEAKAKAYACVCMAEASFSRNKVGTAIDWWQEAVDHDPLNAAYRLSFVAHGLLPLGLKHQALNEIRRALNLDKSNPMAWRLLGHVQVALGDTQGAITALDKLIELDASATPLLDRNDLACDMADWETVENNCKKLLTEHGPHKGNALHQLGLMAFRAGEAEKAIALWDETLMHQCDNRDAVIWNKSIALLSLGRYREGWRLHEQRMRNPREPVMAYQAHRGRPDLLWNNEPPPAKLHVSHEMGFGDAIVMARYLPLLVERGYDVSFEVMDGMAELMQTLPGVKIVPRSPIYPDFAEIGFDYHVPALSLPKLFGTTVETIPWRGPYLKADPSKVAAYRTRIGGATAVGFCWSAGIRTEHGLWLNEYGERKSVKWADIARLAAALPPGVLAVSLQVGPESKAGRLNQYLPDNPTWADTAALIECLDMVVTVDTAVAHLAGALGKPTWLMMHTEGSFHWMLERPGAPWNEKSPWYPSARLFRQKQPHEWEEVIERVAKELVGRRVHQLSEKVA